MLIAIIMVTYIGSYGGILRKSLGLSFLAGVLSTYTCIWLNK